MARRRSARSVFSRKNVLRTCVDSLGESLAIHRSAQSHDMKTNMRSHLRTLLLVTLLLLSVDFGSGLLCGSNPGVRPANQGGPDHNQNGIEDALDIASGVSLDADCDGCPDECDW